MAGGMKLLAKETAIYGMSSIIGKFLNWCLVPMYTRVLTTGEFGVVTNIYGYIALLAVLLTYGMETGFFRFVNKQEENPTTVYSTTLISIASTSILFIITCLAFLNPISSAIGYDDHTDYVAIMAIVIGIDAFSSIPFSFLRYKKKAIRFATLKMISIIITIALNVFFLILCPYLYKVLPETINWFYDPNYKEGYVFVANLLGSILGLMLLIPDFTGFKYKLDPDLLKRMLNYSFPLLVLGIVGVLNQSIDKILYPFLFENREEALQQLGIYGACSRIAVVMAMFTQAFRFAFEPFIFGRKDTKDHSAYTESMKYFIIFSLIIFLGVMFYIDILKYFVGEDFFQGISVVPIVMLGYVFFGIYFNLSIWYKMIDKTYYGAIFSILGFIITLAINILFVPKYGYIASAWASLICNLVMMILSYYFERKNYRMPYDLKSIGFYFGLAAVLYIVDRVVIIDHIALRLMFRTLLFAIFLAITIKRDLPLHQFSFLNRFKNK